MTTLPDVNLFNNLQNAVFTQPVTNIVNQSVVNVDSSAALRFLYEAMAEHEGSGPQEISTCLEGTRTTALQDIDLWKERNDQEQESQMLWLTGFAGSGKSAIAQTVCQRFRAQGLLVVDCFFSRSIGRTHSTYLFLTIAYQLAILNSSLKTAIEGVVQSNPAIVKATLELQFNRLILDPIASAARELPVIFFIVDGLDECQGEDQQVQIIRLSQAAQCRSLPIRFLIASRPEIWIQNTLTAPSAPPFSTVTLIQNDETDSDIRSFYISEFKKIREDPEHILLMPTSLPWPSDEDIERLVQSASGQFIYAKTITRFVGELGHHPVERLKSVISPLGPSTALLTPLDHLDTLYIYILRSVVDWGLTSIVLGALSAVYSDVAQGETLSIIEALHDLKPGDAYRGLRSLHSLVSVPRNTVVDRESMSVEDYRAFISNDNKWVSFYHKSFTDFLHSSQRSDTFHVGLEDSHRRLSLGCLNILRGVSSTVPTRLSSVTWSYAHREWEVHAKQTGFHGNRSLIEKLDQFSFSSWYFLVWKLDKRENWNKLATLRLLEKHNTNAVEAVKKTQSILESLGITVDYLYFSRDMWVWVKQQGDLSIMDFPKLRLKLWTLHKALSPS